MENTMKVKPWGKGQGDFVLIDRKNFDPSFHVEFSESETSVDTPADNVVPEKIDTPADHVVAEGVENHVDSVEKNVDAVESKNKAPIPEVLQSYRGRGRPKS